MTALCTVASCKLRLLVPLIERALNRSPRTTVLLGLLLVAGVTTACSSAPVATAGVAPTAETRTPDQVIRATTLADPASMNALSGARFRPGAAAAAATILAGHPTGDLLWAATWVYASVGTDPAVLTPLLADPDPTIRLIAASAVMSLGDRSGFGVIAASLPMADPLRGSEPIMSIGGFAATRLERYVTAASAPMPPATDTDADAGTYGADWTAWLADHQGALRFDAGSGTWSAP